MTESTRCPQCHATMWRGSLHCCPRREPEWRHPRQSSMRGFGIALAVAFVVGCAIGTAVWLGWCS